MKAKVFVDPKYWGNNAETVAELAGQQYGDQARFAIGAEKLNESRPEDERQTSVQISASLKTTYGKQYGPPSPPQP